MMNRVVQRSLLSIGLLIVSLLVITHLALAALVSTPLNISKSITDAGYPAVAVSQGGKNIGFVWADGYSDSAVNGPIYFKAASDGQTIDKRFTVDWANSTNDQSLTPDIASDPNITTTMHVVWANLARPGGDGTDLFYTIYYASCPTNGSACTTEETVQQVNTTVAGQTVYNPRVATSDNSGQTVVHVVWQFIDSQSNPTETLIYYSARKTGEADWAANSATVSDDVTTPPGEYASHPAIATSTSGSTTYVHVAWASDTNKTGNDNEKIRYCRRAVDGTGVVTSWGSCAYKSWSINDVTGTSDGDHPDYPAVAAISDTVMVLWDELKGSPWPAQEDYYAAYNLSHDSGGNFQGTKHLDPGDEEHLSDHDPSPPPPPPFDVQGSAHARRLQIKATALLTSTANINAIIHAVWHETSNSGADYWHDVHYAAFMDGTCGGCGFWSGAQNETFNNKLSGSSNKSYSMSPDIAVANGELYGFYMEGKTEVGYDVNDTFVFDVIYKGTVVLTDTTTNNPTDGGGIYLPLIMKNN